MKIIVVIAIAAGFGGNGNLSTDNDHPATSQNQTTDSNPPDVSDPTYSNASTESTTLTTGQSML